ncbi:type IV secretion system protein [Desulfovibrio sp. OttesenSCG-928-I05]|nr:type IV secretion system protein [Desulfovibrio sp. OttesenSCG-928-O18]MDL2271413.1 type IV secretion system protein [Desulfovibrio sp. OttesenSCG-928-I05]
MGWFKKEAAPRPAKDSGRNPYFDGRQEWLERYGSYISRANQWRIFSVLAVLALLVSLSCNYVQSSQVKAVPYIIEVDQLGKIGAVARADSASSTPRRLIQAEIAQCISSWRTVTADVELQQKMIDRLSYFMAGAAKGVMREWYETNNPYEIAKSGKLVHVEIKGLPLPVSGDSYRVEWTETVRSHAGIVLDSNQFEATVTIQIQPPTQDVVILRNPGGIYLTAISAGKVIGSTAPKLPEPQGQ